MNTELFDISSRAVEGGVTAARSIMTTDTHSKEYAVSYVSEAAGHAGNVYTVGECARARA